MGWDGWFCQPYNLGLTRKSGSLRVCLHHNVLGHACEGFLVELTKVEGPTWMWTAPCYSWAPQNRQGGLASLPAFNLSALVCGCDSLLQEPAALTPSQ